MAGISFKDSARSYLLDDLAEGATVMKISPGGFPAFNRSVGFYCKLLGADRSEIVKVTGANYPFLTIERGQEGSSAVAWSRGTLIYQSLTATSLSGIVQAEAFRQGAYNPNGALTSLFFGEKFYQTDDELWWKAVGEGVTEWRLIAGEIFIDDVEFSPDPGSYGSGQALTMEVLAAGADIYYTDDGSTPDENSTEYTAPVVMPVGSTTYKARAYGANRWEQPSQNITSGGYTITTEKNWAIIGSDYSSASYGNDLLAVGSSLYALTADGYLLEWDYLTTSWAVAATPPGNLAGNYMYDIRYLNNTLYGTAGAGGLYHFNGSSWVTDFAPSSPTYSSSPNYLCWNGTYLYASLSSGGTFSLHHWTGSAWVSDGGPGCSVLPVVLGSTVYAGYGSNGTATEYGCLWRFDNPGFTKVATRYSNQYSVFSWVYGGEIYAVGSYSYLCKWNGTDAWVYLGTQSSHYLTEDCFVLNGKWYWVGLGRIYEWDTVSTTITEVEPQYYTGAYGDGALWTAPDRSGDEIYMVQGKPSIATNVLFRWQ